MSASQAASRSGLRTTPGTPEFLAEYQAALRASTSHDPIERLPSGSLRWLCATYSRSPEFQALEPATRSVRLAHLRSICDSRTASGAARGDLPYCRMEQRHAREIRDAWAAVSPDSANGRLKALRRLFAWAVEAGHADHNPARDVPRIRTASEGFHTWMLEEIEQYEARHPLGTKARLALELLLNTGGRRSDVVTFGRQMVRDGWLCWIEAKGQSRHRKERAIPILPRLAATINATPSEHLTYLVTEFGKPFTVAGFGNWFKRRCREAGLPHCTAHGLRKAGPTIAAEAGATEHQLMAIFGWESPKQAALYTRKANRRKLAAAAMSLIVPLSGERCPTARKAMKSDGK